MGYFRYLGDSIGSEIGAWHEDVHLLGFARQMRGQTTADLR